MASGAGGILAWWLEPWFLGGATFRERAMRILLLCGSLAFTVLPAMMAWYGIDGWLWPLTAAVVTLGPVGVLVVDELAERVDGATSPDRRLGAGIRLAVLPLGLVAGIAAAYASMFVVPLLPESDLALLRGDFRRTMGILAGVGAGLVIAGSLLWYRTETWRLRAVTERARFEVLSRQMQPHFLFNALASLKELQVVDPARAEQATQQLADLYRLLLVVSRHPTSRLGDELAVVENYLAIERIRFGDRLAVRFEVEPGLHELRVPSLVLQTLAENAVKHGIAGARAGGEVRIAARGTKEGWVALEVANTGAPYAPRPDHDGQGLANTRARLELMYGSASGFTVTSGPEGTRVAFAVSGREVTT
jgi:signal transduction histidine kinase